MTRVDDIKDYEDIEREYSTLIDHVRLDKQEWPLSVAENELMSDLAWELHSDFNVIIKSSELYRNNISGDYVVVSKIPRLDISEQDIRDTLEERLNKLEFGASRESKNQPYDRYKASVAKVEVHKKHTEITMEVLLPKSMRYMNILNYIKSRNNNLN